MARINNKAHWNESGLEPDERRALFCFRELFAEATDEIQAHELPKSSHMGAAMRNQCDLQFYKGVTGMKPNSRDIDLYNGRRYRTLLKEKPERRL